MYWHNPTTQTSERVATPSDDEGAIHMLAGHSASATFVSEYAELRRLGTPIERALVSVGHEFRLRCEDSSLIHREFISFRFNERRLMMRPLEERTDV
jgi:hypothetical protein